VAFPNPTGILCGNIVTQGGPGPHWQQWVDPRVGCPPWEHIYQTRPTYPALRADWEAALQDAILCCEASRAWTVSQEKMDLDFSEDCLGFIQFLGGGGGGKFPPSMRARWGRSTGPHLLALMNLPPNSEWDVTQGPLETQQLYIEAWKWAGHGNRTRFQMCRGDVVGWLRKLFKTHETAWASEGGWPGRFKFPEPDAVAAADRADKLRGTQARASARELLQEEDRAVTISTERKKRTAAATLEPGECVTAWDGVVCAPEEVLIDEVIVEEPPAPPARAGLALAVVLGIGGAVVAGPPGALGGAALGAWLDRQGTP
jgi:hypothetical protein